jgi:hypothetical protein
MLDNHSSISSYPINYDTFPLARNCKFIEIYLNENEYIFIPAFWMHWVFTEPFNISINYSIHGIKDDNKNLLINNIKKKKPFTNKIDKKINFCFNSFFKKILNNKFLIVFSSNSNITPVKKTDISESFVKYISINESLSIEYKDYFKYIGQNNYNEPYLNTLENFITDVNNNINYIPGFWINLDKSINSGLHYDRYDNIIINFIGKKKILLAHPDYHKYMYFKDFPMIELRK